MEERLEYLFTQIQRYDVAIVGHGEEKLCIVGLQCHRDIRQTVLHSVVNQVAYNLGKALVVYIAMQVVALQR